MSKLYTISDLHLGHTNMALKRGFSSVEEHDSHIIDSWNSIVSKRDVVWIVGDVTMERASEYHKLSLLQGIKKVVGGNHDMPQHTKHMLEYVNSYCGAWKYNGYIFTHIPVHPKIVKEFKGNVHGHDHDHHIRRLFIKDRRYINVSAEMLGYKPILIQNILKY